MVKKAPKSPQVSTTQKFIEIDEIQDDIMLLRDHSAVVVIEIGAVNFYLLSQDEQASLIYAYGNLLNSLSFPVQILIHSSRMDISSYLEYVKNKMDQQKSDVIRNRLLAYDKFIRTVVKRNTVLQKRFFFIVPFSPMELGATSVGKKFSKEYLISRAKTSIYPKRDHLLRLLARLGLKAMVMQKQELTELFYNVYNPSSTGKQLAPIDTYTDVVLTGG